MNRIVVFCEDSAHEQFVRALIKRMSETYDVEIELNFLRSTGGHGRVIQDLDQYVTDLESGTVHIPDLIIVARDANCRGRATAQDEILDVLGPYQEMAVLAIPSPHIERWLLLDSEAFRSAVGTGCDAPDHKCEKERYKEMLINQIRDAGITPQIRGLEYTEDIVNNMNLASMITNDPSLGNFIQDIKTQFRNLSQ